MAIPVAVKAAATVVTDPKLLKIVGGILLGLVIIIIAPIAILLGVGDVGGQIDWNSPELQAQIETNMADEQRARLRHFADIMQVIEDEITAQTVDIEPIKAQVIFMCALGKTAEYNGIYADFISCFAGAAEDETVFQNITDKFGVAFTAEEKEKILLLCEKAIESQTVPPSALHIEIGGLTADSAVAPTTGAFANPFHNRDCQSCLTSGYGKRRDPLTGEISTHAGLDLAADEGTEIYAAKPGKALFVRWDPDGYGNYLVIDHGGAGSSGGGEATLYGHCSAILVAEGDTVTTDTVIARVGSTGRSTGAHLHFEVVIDGQPKNPIKFLEVPTR
jgi:hypothetical protein